MYHQNWSEEMDQIGCCDGGSEWTSSSSNKNNSNESSSSSSSSISTTTGMNKSSRSSSKRMIWIRNKGGGSWRSYTSSSYNNSSVFTAFWLILSVGSSVAVMAYQNDLSAISSSSSGISGTSKSNSASSANSRYGCVWSRTDSSNTATTTATTTTTTTTSWNTMNGMYASSGNDPFHHQQQSSQRTFPALSSSSSTSPYYSSSLLPSGGSSSTSGGSGALILDCNIRTLNTDLENHTALFSREQVETRAARVKCSDKLFFQSLLLPNQTLLKLRNLQNLKIEACKIRKLPSAAFSKLNQLMQLNIHTGNSNWSPSVGLEIESGAFEGLGQLESLDLSYSNIFTLFPDANVLCPMRNLVKLNVSSNRLVDFEIDGDGGDKEGNYECTLSRLQSVDLSFNSLRRMGKFSRLPRLVELHLQHNLLEELEDTAFSGTNLQILNLSSNRLVALPPSIFTSGNQLRELSISNNSISALSPKIFTGLSQLLLLDLSRNSLTSQWVQGEVFSHLLRLVVLKLSYNKLSYIDGTIFKDLRGLQALHLDNNQIETINSLAFQNLKNVHVIDLSNNRIKINGHFSNLFSLKQLYLDHNFIEEIYDTSFKNCSLEDLGLGGNRLTHIPKALKDLQLLKTLDLGDNKISSLNNDSFLGLDQVIGLRLVDNSLEELPKGICKTMPRLRVLNVAQNKISKISSGTFSGCPDLRALRLDSNLLEEIPLTLAEELPSLLWLNISVNRLLWADYRLLPPTVEWLDVSHNQMHSLVQPDNDNDRRKQNVTIPGTFNLRVLDASYNQLKYLDHSHIPPLLDTLRLNYNRIQTISSGSFKKAAQLRRVELIGNDIEYLALASIIFPQVPKDRNLPEMYLGHNPFFCDCSNEWLTRVSQLAILRREYPRIVDLDAIVCRRTFPRSAGNSLGGESGSPSLSLSSLSSLSSSHVLPLVEARPNDFLCTYESHCPVLCHCCEFACDCENKCPTSCSCFHDTAWSQNIVECSSSNFTEIPSRIPMDATEIYLDGNYMTELGSHIFIGKKNLRSLYLNGSQIETIRNKTFNGLKSLEILKLNDNKLTQLIGHEFIDLQSVRELYLHNNLITFIAAETFSRLSFLQVLRLDGNLLVELNVWELTKSNGYLNSVMLSANPWTCDCTFIVPFRRWVASLKNTIVVDFALAKCVPTEEQQQDGSSHNSSSSSAIMNSGASAITSGSSTTATTMTITHPTISSMCAPLSQSSFNYNQDNPALLPSAASASSSNGGSNHVLLMNNHISSMGGAARSNVGSSQLSGPYHHAHLENQAGNYHQGFPQNENIIATTAAAGGGGLRRSKTGHGGGSGGDDDDDDSSGNSTFFTLLVTFIAIILVATIAFLVGLVTFRKRGRLSQGSSWCCWCFSKCGINGSSSALPKCLSAPNSSSANEGGGTGTPSLGGNSGDMDYYYYSDQEKLFDAYFIYSQKDEEFVTEKLTCELERGGGAPIIIHPQQQHYYPATQPGTKKLRLCLHYRDLCLAPDNPWSSEMILSACDASKRVVLVISNNFLNGEWTNNHFRTSVHSAIQQHCRKLIVIKLPPVSDQSVSSICSSVAAATAEQQHRFQQQQQRNNGNTTSNKQSSFTPSTTAKLEWGDKNFWPQFRLLLPSPQIPSTGNNNRNDIITSTSNFPTISSHATANSQLPYTTNLNPNGMSFVNAANNDPTLPYQIPMIASHHHYHQPNDPVSTLASHSQQQPHFIAMMHWTGQQQQQQQLNHQGIPSLPLGHSSSVHPVPSQLTPQHFGYSNIDGFQQNNMSSQQNNLFSQQHQQQQHPLHFSSSNNNRQSHRQQQHSNLPLPPHHLHHPSNHNNPPGHGHHIHSLSQLSNMSSAKSPVEANYSSSAVSSGNEEFEHVYSTLDSPLESPCSDLGPGHVAGQFEGAAISGAQVNRHQIQHSTSSGISSGSDATSGTGGCHGGNAGPPMYFV